MTAYLLFTVIVFGSFAVMWSTDKAIDLILKAAFALATLLGSVLLLYSLGFIIKAPEGMRWL
jgi:hypothetical protein